MEGFSSGQMECDNLEESDMRPRSSKRQAAGGLLGYCPVVLFVLFLTVIAACSPEAVVETRATLDLSSIPLSTPTLEPAIFEEKNASCVNDARFVEDLTIPDGYEASQARCWTNNGGYSIRGAATGARAIGLSESMMDS